MPSDNPFSQPEVPIRGRALFVVLALSGGLVVLAILGLVGGWWMFAALPDSPPVPVVQASAPDSRSGETAKPIGPAPATRDKLLPIFSTLIVAQLYQSYLNIGMLADASEHNLYPEAECRQRLNQVLSLMAGVDRQMLTLSKTGLEEEDAKTVADCRAIAALLRVQASELRAYWETPPREQADRKEHQTRYRKAHDEAWAALKEMLVKE